MYNSYDWKHKIFRFVQRCTLKIGFTLAFPMMELERKRCFDIYLKPDYVRISSLELAAEEIRRNNVTGNVCELGVYRGEFAQFINAAFPDRKLYLFDTFEGFHTGDILKDRTKNFSTGDQDFSNTCIKLVLEKMKYPENCIIKKGHFPESSYGLEDFYAFVSIDADLYEPTYEGLRYFYPRLGKGGYIFIHDFNNKTYLGVREAVTKFCRENGVSYFPLSDGWGSVVITK